MRKSCCVLKVVEPPAVNGDEPMETDDAAKPPANGDKSAENEVGKTSNRSFVVL